MKKSLERERENLLPKKSSSLSLSLPKYRFSSIKAFTHLHTHEKPENPQLIKKLSRFPFLNPSLIFLNTSTTMEKKKKTSSTVLLYLLLVTNFYIHHTFSIIDPVDFLALQAIRKSLNDMPGSNFFSSWDFTSDPCTFSGIYCISNKVISLNLGDPRAGSPGLIGHLNPAIGKLSSLMELTIVPGHLYGTLPNTLSQLKNLRFLAISKNFISGEIPYILSDLRGLQTIDLSYNQLSGSIPSSLAFLRSLSNLILCHNHLSNKIPPFFSKTLTRLDLKHNRFTGILSPMSLPPSLQYLSLSSNQLSGPVDRLLSRLNKLHYLDLSMNKFTGNIPGSLFTFPIGNLQLQRNLFSGVVHPYNFVRIPSVDLSHNVLSGQISPLFSTVQNLYLNNNRFTGQVPGSFVERLMAASIQILYLQHNYLTGIEINPTAEIPLSSSLCLQYNCMIPPLHTTCPAKAGMQKTRPPDQCR